MHNSAMQFITIKFSEEDQKKGLEKDFGLI